MFDRTHSFSINKSTRILTDDEIRTVAPSVFADSAHESRSSRYLLIPTSDILTGMRSEGFQPTYVGEARCRTAGRVGYTKHVIRFRHRQDIEQGGDVFPEIVLINSHDGSSAYNIMAGMFRQVCANGLICGESIDAIKVPHKQSARHDVIEGSFRVIESSRAALSQVTEMKQLTLSVPEQQIFAEAAHAIRFEESDAGKVITPSKLLAPKRYEDRASDLWTTLNVVQENVIRGGAKGRDSKFKRVTARAVKGIDQSTALNRALWTLAERMAQLKAA